MSDGECPNTEEPAQLEKTQNEDTSDEKIHVEINTTNTANPSTNTETNGTEEGEVPEEGEVKGNASLDSLEEAQNVIAQAVVQHNESDDALLDRGTDEECPPNQEQKHTISTDSEHNNMHTVTIQPLQTPPAHMSNSLHSNGQIIPDQDNDDPELEDIKKRVREMEAEAERLKEMQTEVEAAMMGGMGGVAAPGMAPVIFPSLEEKIEADARSIYVGQVDYNATAEEVEMHFRGCGALNRVTILCDKFTGQPKGFAYIEFADKESVETAMALDGSMLKGRVLKVMPKRTNKPGISLGDRGRARGRRMRGRGMRRPGVGRGAIGRGAGRGFIQRPPFPY